MSAADLPMHRTTTPRILEGLEAGIVGGLAMLFFLILDEVWRHRPWWTIPNLLGSTFYGARAFRMGPGLASASGIALQLMVCGLVGVLFGMVLAGISSRVRAVLLGLAAGLVWYLFSQRVLFPEIGPLVPVYAPEPATLLAHLLFGLCLGRFPYFVRKGAAGGLVANP